MIKEWRNFIKSDPGVMMGKPVITGTRITVEQMWCIPLKLRRQERRQVKFLADECVDRQIVDVFLMLEG